MKQITVFGANGKVGTQVVKELRKRGYGVRGFVHKANGLVESKGFSLVQGDIHDPSAVNDAVSGSVAVVSALGSWGTPQKDIQRVGMAHIVAAMNEYKVKRIISLTGSEARAKGDYLSLVHRFAHVAAAIIAGKILIDGEVHIKILETSQLDWTVIRSPVMNESGSAHYELSNKRSLPWKTINRHAVAMAMVDQLEDGQYLQQAPFINR